MLKDLVLKHGARDSTLRGTAMAELESMRCHCSQWAPGREVPERQWIYRFAKRFLFDDFGAYDHLNAEKLIVEKGGSEKPPL